MLIIIWMSYHACPFSCSEATILIIYPTCAAAGHAPAYFKGSIAEMQKFTKRTRKLSNSSCGLFFIERVS